MYDKREVIGQEVAREISTILEGMWKNRVEGVRKGGEKIAEVMERAMWCENNMPARIEELTQEKILPQESTVEVSERVTVLQRPPCSTLKGPRPAPNQSITSHQVNHQQTEVTTSNGDQRSSSDRNSSRSYSPEQPRNTPSSQSHTPSPRSAPLELEPVPQPRPQTLDLPIPTHQLRKKTSTESNITSTRRRSGEMERGGGFSSDSLDDLIPPSSRNRSSLTSPLDTNSDCQSYSSNRNSAEVQRVVIPPKGFVMDDDLDSPSTGRIRWEDEQPRDGRRSQQESRREEVIELPSSVFRANANFSAQVLPSNEGRSGRYENYGRPVVQAEQISSSGHREEARGKDNGRMERTLSTDSERNFVMRMKEKYAIERGERDIEPREEKRVSSPSQRSHRSHLE